MIFWLKFALRSVLRRRRRTLITFLSVSFGIAMLIVLGSIMVGVNDTMIKNGVALQSGHLTLDAPWMALADAQREELSWENKIPPELVEAILPRMTFPAILRYGKITQALQVRLVDPKREANWSPVPDKMQAGEWLNTEAGLVIGQALADQLRVTVGESLNLLTSTRSEDLVIRGVFRTGVDLLDRGVGYLSLPYAMETRPDQSVQLQAAIFVRPGADLAVLQEELQSGAPGSGEVSRWQQKLPELEQLVRLNEFSMQIMMVLVIAILAFGVANSLLISVMDRYRNYGILKAIGVRPREIVVTVVGEALVICLGACLFGTLLGVVISLVWGQIGLDISHYTSYNPHFSINAMIYPRLVPVMVFLPQGLALLTALLASIWPALVAARRQVSRTMRDL